MPSSAWPTARAASPGGSWWAWRMTAEYRECAQAEQIILEYVKAHGWITRREVVELCKIGPYQATRLLKRLVEEGKLTRYGMGEGARYALHT